MISLIITIIMIIKLIMIITTTTRLPSISGFPNPERSWFNFSQAQARSEAQRPANSRWLRAAFQRAFTLAHWARREKRHNRTLLVTSDIAPCQASASTQVTLACDSIGETQAPRARKRTGYRFHRGPQPAPVLRGSRWLNGGWGWRCMDA